MAQRDSVKNFTVEYRRLLPMNTSVGEATYQNKYFYVEDRILHIVNEANRLVAVYNAGEWLRVYPN